MPCTMRDEVVIQRYLNNPFLVDGYKFDLRLYVVVTGIEDNDVHAFLAKEGLARFCTEKYQAATRTNLKNQFMHLTNYAVNKTSPAYVHGKDGQDVSEINFSSKRTLSALFKQITKQHGEVVCSEI